MGVFEIWGQTDEENQAHGDSYTINEALNVEADFAAAAVQAIVTGSLTDGDHPMGPPANGDHWHFKVVNAFDHTDVVEFAVRLNLLPTLEMAEIISNAGEDGSI